FFSSSWPSHPFLLHSFLASLSPAGKGIKGRAKQEKKEEEEENCPARRQRLPADGTYSTGITRARRRAEASSKCGVRCAPLERGQITGIKDQPGSPVYDRYR
ncbi:hypothetical protein GGR56DRAFT_653250, partial [Xylariaceae sp. FL0804]